jgi:hypothetical protein
MEEREKNAAVHGHNACAPLTGPMPLQIGVWVLITLATLKIEFRNRFEWSKLSASSPRRLRILKPLLVSRNGRTTSTLSDFSNAG